MNQQCIIMYILWCSISKYHYSLNDTEHGSYVNNVSIRFFLYILRRHADKICYKEGWSFTTEKECNEIRKKTNEDETTLRRRRRTNERKKERMNRRHVRMITTD